MRSNFNREWWFFLRDRQGLATVAASALLAVVTVVFGLNDVATQRADIASLSADTVTDLEDVLPQQGDAGSAAYYSFRLVVDPPSELAFAARGVRDQLPWKHRIRLLALEGQVYEHDAGNPELGQIGRIDYTFLISVLAPLLVILLLHDIVDVERRHKRFDLLVATTGRSARFILWRAGLRASALVLALIVPFIATGLWSGAAPGAVLGLALLSGVYVIGWSGAATWVAEKTRSAATSASVMLGIWAILVLIIPLAGGAVAEQRIEVPQGGEILLQQRETVNRAWDIPKAETMTAFFASHPELKDYTPTRDGFEWEWYYAFQHLGDLSVRGLSDALRQGIRERDNFMHKVSLLSPPLLIDRQFTRAAETDIAAFQAYDQCVRDFHKSLRVAHYPMLFNQTGFDPEKLLALDSTHVCP
ncbi:MAG: DUF3526 domain-containing protein [Pseudomonadota bacterium]